MIILFIHVAPLGIFGLKTTDPLILQTVQTGGAWIFPGRLRFPSAFIGRQNTELRNFYLFHSHQPDNIIKSSLGMLEACSFIAFNTSCSKVSGESHPILPYGAL